MIHSCGINLNSKGLLFAGFGGTAMKFTLKFLHELCKQAPNYELNFLPDQSMVEYV